jgi:hypothetical protein
MVQLTGPCAHGILPPFLLERMAESPDPATRKWALKSLAASAAARAYRRALATQPAMAAIPSPEGKKLADEIREAIAESVKKLAGSKTRD